MSLSKFATQEEYFASLMAGKPPKSEDKPVVHFRPLEHADFRVVGGFAHVIPVDHPSIQLNGRVVTTSYIVAVNADGSFETRNTKYVPEAV